MLSESGSSSERCFFVPPDVGAHDSDSSYAPTEDEQDPPGRQAGALNTFEHGFQPESFQDLLPWLVGHAIQDRRVLDPGEEMPSMDEDRDECLGEQLLALERIFPRSPSNRVFRLYSPGDRVMERMEPTL